MTRAATPVIPYEQQSDPKTNRMCGAAALRMVYRSFGDAPETDTVRKRGRDRRVSDRPAPGRERRSTGRRTEEASQAEIFAAISKPNRFGSVASTTHLMVQDAQSRGFAAVAVQARYPLQALSSCLDQGIRAILNHRLRADSPAGHFSVLVDLGPQDVVLHDPFAGPHRRVPHAELLELWRPGFPSSEIAGNVLIGIAKRPAPVPACPLCATPVPPSVPCPRCGKSVSLRPPGLMGCVGAGSCMERLWNYVCCPSCDYMFTFSMPAPAEQPAASTDGGPWNLGPLFAELDRFRDRVLAVPGVADRADVRQQLEAIQKNKERLKLAETEEAGLQKERDAQLSAAKEKYGQAAAPAPADPAVSAVRQAHEQARAAQPAAPVDGGALGDALLKDLGIVKP